MKFEQKFLEPDFIELEKVFSKTMTAESSKLLFWRKPWVKISLFVLSGILFLCSGVLYFLEGFFSNNTKLYFVVAVLALCWPLLLEALKKKKEMLPAKMVRNKYREPFDLNFKEDSLVYRKEEFLYTSVSTVVEYKNFLFILANKKWLVIKTDEEEKEFMMEKIKKYAKACFVKKEEIFNLKEF